MIGSPLKFSNLFQKLYEVKTETPDSNDSVLKTDHVFQNTSKFHGELVVRGSIVALGGSISLVVSLINDKVIGASISAIFALSGLSMVAWGMKGEWNSRNVQEI